MRCTVQSVRRSISAAVAAQPWKAVGGVGENLGAGGSAVLGTCIVARLVCSVRPSISLSPRSKPAEKVTPGA